MTIWKKVKDKLMILKPLDDISITFHFRDAEDELYQNFKHEFNIKAEVPDYVNKNRELYEVGNGNLWGMRISVYGPHKPNPNYIPTPDWKCKKDYDEHKLRQLSLILWQAIAHGLLQFDSYDIKTFFKSKGRDWDRYYKLAINVFGRREVKERVPLVFCEYTKICEDYLNRCHCCTHNKKRSYYNSKEECKNNDL